MQLLAITYTNIGPFQDTRTLTVKGGKYLIKAPIGSGKSFLFFDGPIFALYKYSGRNMLNVQSKKGSIKVLFESDQGDLFYAVRQLTPGRSKDKVQSYLYTVTATSEQLEELLPNEVIAQGHDIHSWLTPYIEEISFKNDTELQKSIELLLPPREVLMHTQFLLQDSDNIFAMQAAERIEVFKNIFALLSIDEAKDIVAEKRRELQTKLKVMSDTSLVNKKLHDYLQSAKSFFQKLGQQSIIAELCAGYQPLFADIDLVGDDLAISNFSLKAINTDKVSTANQLLETKREALHQQVILLEEKQKQAKEQAEELARAKQELAQFQNQLTAKQKELQAIDAKKLADAKATKLEKTKARDAIISDYNRQEVATTIQSKESLLQANEISVDTSDHSLRMLNNLVDTLIQTGKNIANQLELRQSQIKDLQQSEKELQEELKSYELREGTKAYEQLQSEVAREKERITRQIEELKKRQNLITEQQKSLLDQITTRKQQLAKLEGDYKQASSFHCQKIEADCPFIEQIAHKPLERLQAQITSLKDEIASIEKKNKEAGYDTQLKEIVTQIESLQTKQQKLVSNPEEALADIVKQLTAKKEELTARLKERDYTTKIEKLQKEITSLQEQKVALGQLLQSLKRKEIKEHYAQRENITKEIEALDKQIATLETQQAKIDQIKADITTLETKIKTQQEQITKLSTKLETLQKQQSTEAENKLLQDYREIKEIKQSRDDLAQTISNIQTLVDEHREKDLQIQQLKLDEKRVSNLYHIFSKELMYVVLEEALPTLFDIINAYLAQVVDYTVSFALEKKASDKLELEVSIQDEKGTRPIKALSGGQKVILKLVRILAVASYTKVNSLFLDETINNLDKDTVGRVADMLEDFVKQHECKLYVVTHSTQIQEMAIWDEIVSI